MTWDKQCSGCVYNITDWLNEQNPTRYCSNDESEYYGDNTEYIFGCEEWRDILEDD